MPETNASDKEVSCAGAEIVVGLDIGTAKVCALVAAPEDDGETLKILGIGITESEGLNRGVVTNIERTVNTLQKVVQQGEQQSGLKITEVIVGIAGDHIESFQSHGLIGISSTTKEIARADVDRLLQDTSNISIPSGRKIIHLIPQDYIIDGQDGITDPVGMSGVRMEANFHVVTGLVSAIENIHKCVERLGIKVRDIVLEPIASSHAVLTEEEKEVGVALIDIGGGTTDLAIFENHIIRFTSVFGIGGRQVTNDIREILGIIATQAEKIKKQYGHACIDSILDDEIFMIPGIGGRQPTEVTKSNLCRIIQPRMTELFEIALSEIRRSGYAHKLGAGIVITGGASLLRGSEELASRIFGMPVKVGMPTGIRYTGLGPEIESPVFSTSVGLALYGLKNKRSVRQEQPAEPEQSAEPVIEEKPEKVEISQKKKNMVNKVFDFIREL